MPIRNDVSEFVALGPLLPSEDVDIDKLKRQEAALLKIGRPVSREEAVLLATAFGPDECFGLAWTLLHLIETAPGGPPLDAIGPSENEWVRRIAERVANAKTLSALPRIESTLRELVEFLVRGDYARIEQATNGVRLSAAELESAVVEYGRALILPPAAAYLDLDVIPVRSAARSAYSVRFPLYTREEGQSDLELQATFLEGTPGAPMTVEIDNILVA